MLHLPLLGGLALIGLPVLLHLLMRQRPKHILFPAFRFLQQRARTNRRKVRLRHLLLLLLRMLLLALICLALATLRGKGQVAVVVLLVDTTPSMEYVSAGKSRLDDAKARANEVLNTIAGDSRVAVVETGDTTQQWGSVEEARDKIGKLTIRPGGQPVTSTLSAAYRLFADDKDKSGAAPRRQLYVLSDRTVASWEPSRLADLQGQRDRLGSPEITTVYIDLGIEKPVDVAITQLDVKPASVPANREVVVKATVTATGQGCDTEVVCKIVGEATAERKPIKLGAGESEVLEFVNRKLAPGRQYQAEVTLASSDALLASNSRFVTFEVRGSRKILTITDDSQYALAWDLAFQAKGDFEDTVNASPDQIQTAEQLKPYVAVCLLSVRSPSDDLWAALKQYVEQGGNLLVIPGREEMLVKSYNNATTNDLLPARPIGAVKAEVNEPARWEPLNRKHPLLAKFVSWKDQEDIGFLKSPRTANRYWAVTKPAPQDVIVSYAVKDKPPALLERLALRKRGQGRVLMLTTALDFRPVTESEPWNDYLSTAVQDGFYVVLANELVGYMVGDLEEPAFNFASGQVVTLPLPPIARFPEYTLDAPGVTGPDTRVVRGDADSELAIRLTNFAGNARVSGGGTPPAWTAAFSLNPPGAEFQLDRLPAEEIEKLFGPDSVVAPGQNRPLADALGARARGPVDWFPWLMLAFLGLLVIESIVANRFYKPEPATENAEFGVRNAE